MQQGRGVAGASRSWQNGESLVQFPAGSGLFLKRAEHTTPSKAYSIKNNEKREVDVPPVRVSEVRAAVLWIQSKNITPGSDGIPALVLTRAHDHMTNHFGVVLDAILASGRFPECCKSGKLVLFKKPERTADSACRPIVLLDEAFKLFERVLSALIVRLLCNLGPWSIGRSQEAVRPDIRGVSLVFGC